MSRELLLMLTEQTDNGRRMKGGLASRLPRAGRQRTAEGGGCFRDVRVVPGRGWRHPRTVSRRAS